MKTKRASDLASVFLLNTFTYPNTFLIKKEQVSRKKKKMGRGIALQTNFLLLNLIPAIGVNR